MRTLVTGATGFVGSHLIPALVQRNKDVRCLVRPTSDRRWLANHGVEFVFGDVSQPDACHKAVEGVDVVFHLAGLTKALRREDFFAVNVGGTANLLAACATQPKPPRIVIVSSLAAAGPAPEGLPTEDAPCAPITPYGESKLEAEALAAKWQDAVPITVVRPPMVYGPHDRESLPLFRLAKLGLRFTVLGERRLSYVEVSDLVRGLLLAAETPRAIGRTYYLASPEPCRLGELLKLVASTVSRLNVPVPVPPLLILGAGFVSGWFARLRRRPHIFDRYKARDMVARHWVCNPRRAEEELGFRATVPLDVGLQRTAEWYRQQKWL